MNKILKKIVSSIGGLILLFTGFSTAFAGMPAPLDDPGKVKIALVRFLSTGDFFQAYLGGVESQAQATHRPYPCVYRASFCMHCAGKQVRHSGTPSHRAG